MESPLIEPLEDRIAPATLVDPFTVTYTDKDGDMVMIKTSKAIFSSESVANTVLKFDSDPSGGTPTAVNGSNAVAEQLQTFDLTGSGFSNDDFAAGFRALAAGTNITVQVVPQAGVGNGKVDVGYIKAAVVDHANLQFVDNIDLGTVTIGGDLGRIDAGDNITTPAIRVLHVGSMGKTSTQDPLDSGFQSNLLASVGRIQVDGDVDGASIHLFGARFGSIGRLTIGGALRGGATDDTGQIVIGGKIGRAVIGDIVGGGGSRTGAIFGNLGDPTQPTSIGSLHVLGSITGGAGVASGQVFVFSLPSVQIDHDLAGNVDPAATNTGVVHAQDSIGTIKVGGFLRGGGGTSGGEIFSNNQIRFVSIGEDVVGSGGDSSGSIVATSIHAGFIGGSLLGGAGSDSGEVSATALRSLNIVHNVHGGTAGTSSVVGRSGIISVGTASHIVIGDSLLGNSGNTSGSILATGGLGTIAIGGNLQGGTGNASGEILTLGTLTKLSIAGDLIGGTTDSASELTKSGYVEAKRIFSLTATNVTAGSNAGAGGIASSGAIRATQDIGAIALAGNLQGSTVPSSADATKSITNRAIISAAGFGSGAGKTDLAIKSIVVGATMDRAEILAGYNTTISSNARGNLVDGNAQIGVVHVHDLLASSIVAGVAAGTNGFFGNAMDTAGPKPVSNSALVSKIARVIVDGSAAGSANPNENFGIVAQWVQAVHVGANAISLQPGASNDKTPIAINGNLFVLEV